MHPRRRSSGSRRPAILANRPMAAAALVLLLLHPPALQVAHAQPATETIPPDARSHGMGRAFTAIAEGPSACWWNPAALGLMSGVWGSPYSRYRLIPDFGDHVFLHPFGLAVGRRGAGVGIHLSELDYGKGVVTTLDGTALGSFRPWEYTLKVGGGIDLLRGRGDPRTRLAVGANARYTRLHLAPAWATPAGVSGTGQGWDLDLGTLASYRVPLRPVEGGSHAPFNESRHGALEVRAGAVVRGVLKNEIKWAGLGQTDPMGRILRGGLAVSAALPTAASLEELGPAARVTFSAEGEKDVTHGGARMIRHLGLEAALLNMVFVRWGHIKDKDGDVIGRTFGLGAGIDLSPRGFAGAVRGFGFRVDYAEVPQARVLRRLNLYTLSAWVRL